MRLPCVSLAFCHAFAMRLPCVCNAFCHAFAVRFAISYIIQRFATSPKHSQRFPERSFQSPIDTVEQQSHTDHRSFQSPISPVTDPTDHQTLSPFATSPTPCRPPILPREILPIYPVAIRNESHRPSILPITDLTSP
jgi:hypothetical protein